MKWFQVDSDTPNDPKVKAVLRELGPAGVGGLFLLWCHIADHGIRRPGWSLDSNGRPIPEHELMIASELTTEQFTKLVAICTASGHFVKAAWDRRKVIAIPAMASRADTYTKRVVRTGFEPSSKKVGQSSSTTQDNTGPTNKSPNPLSAKGGRRRKPRRSIDGSTCPHEDRCPTSDACIARCLSEGRKAS